MNANIGIESGLETMTYNTLQELYQHTISTYSDRPWVSMYEGESLTYRDFAERVDSVVEMLYDAGIKPGDKVALLCRNMPNWSVGYFAAVSQGMVIVPILTGFSPEELGKIIEHSDAKALLVSDRLFGNVPNETVEKLDIVIRMVTLTVVRQTLTDQPRVDPYKAKPEDLAAIIYTSGTTSAPKGVMLTHGNLTWQVKMGYDLFPINRNDVFMSILPLPHTYECSIGMLYPFSRGSSVVYFDKPPTVTLLLPALRQIRPTIMLVVPLIIEKMFRAQVAAPFNRGKYKKRFYSIAMFRKLVHRTAGKRLNKIFGGRLRFFGIGGAKLESETERFLQEAKFPYSIGYGLTETAPLIAGAVPGKVTFQSSGPVLKDIEARIENVDPKTGEGEIVVNSPSTMKGYYKNPEATKAVFTSDGWFRTKDLGRFDEKGNLYILGRLDSMIVGAGGENIYPEEIESVLNSHSLVSDSLVKQDRGNLVALVYFNNIELERRYHDMKESFNIRMAEIKKEVLAYVNSKVSKSSQVTMVEEQQSEFEKTPTHKIKRFKYDKAEDEKKNKSSSKKI